MAALLRAFGMLLLLLLLGITTSAYAGVVVSGGVELVQEGGTAVSNNLATGKLVFAKDEIGVAPHFIPLANDGSYGNTSSWVAGSGDSFIGIQLGATPIVVGQMAFGRDNTDLSTDRALGTYTVQYTTVPNPNAATPDASWTTIGTLDYQSAGGANFAQPHVRHRFTFSQVAATGIRLKTVTASDYIAIDELELYGPGVTLTGGGLRLLAEGGAADTGNLAAGRTAFAKDSYTEAGHALAHVNDGTYGNASSWLAASADSFVGIPLGATPQRVSRVAFGRDNSGIIADRALGGYTLQFTSVPNPDAATPDASWTTIGTLDYQVAGGYRFSAPAVRHLFEFAPVMATGLRLRTQNAGIAVDELEIYNGPAIRVEQPAGTSWGGEYTAVAWGSNDAGKSTVPVAAQTGVVSVAAGYDHTLALKTDGTVIAWGDNASGQGNVPVGLTGVRAIAAGFDHSVALKADGTVVAWGFSYGAVPATLSGVKAISAGWYHTLALKNDGSVVAWGNNSFGQCDVPGGLLGVQAISGGKNHSLLLKADGTVVAFGWNLLGQISVPPDLTDVRAVAAGGGHSVALKNDGTVVCWGNNELGQLNIPVGLSGVRAIAAGGDPSQSTSQTLALKDDGTVVGWGSGGADVPAGLTGVMAISAGAGNSVAVKFGNEVPLVAYGVHLPASTTTKTFTVTNPGGTVLTLTSILTTGGQAAEFVVDTAGTALSLAPGASTTFTVAFTPTSTATRATTLRISSDAPDRPSYDIALNGNITDTVPPLFLSAPDNAVVTTTNLAGTAVSYPLATAVDNSGAPPAITYSHASGSTFPQGKTIVTATATDGSGNVATSSFTISVSLPAPVLVETGGGLAVGNLSIGKTAFAKDALVPVGQGIAKVNDGLYGNANGWIAGTADSFIGINLGATPVTVSQVAFGRDNLGAFGDRAIGSYTLQFTTVPNPTAATPDASWVSFSPLEYPGSLPSPALRHRYSFTPVQATGVRLKLQTTAFEIGIDELELYDYAPAAEITVEQPAGTPLTTGTASLAFASQNLASDSTAKTFTLKSSGTAALSIGSVTTTGGQAGDFIVSTSGMAANLPHTSGSTTFSIVFRPTVLGIRSTTLRIASNDADTPDFDITLTGNGIDTQPPVIQPHGNVTATASAPDGATVSYASALVSDNSGVAPTVTYSHPSGSLFPIGNTTVTITTTDASDNTATATFVVSVTAAPRLIVEQPVGTVLTGTPPSVSLGDVALAASGTRTFTVRNTGLAVLTISAISVTGGQAAEFSVNTTGTATSLAISASTTFNVSFAPTSGGIRSTTLRLASNDPTIPGYDITLSGNGVDSSPPVITSTPGSFSVLASSAAGVVVLYPPATATDNGLTPPTLSYSHASGSLFPVGSTTVTITATDTAGNTANATIAITVTSTTTPQEVPIGGTVPGNLATGKIAFAKDDVGVAPHTIAKVNDGLYGNTNSWIAGSLDSFVGINLGATAVPIGRIAFGRDHLGVQTTRANGTYTLQYTTAPNPTAATPDASWQTIGSITYPGSVANHNLRHLYAFPGIVATGIRLKTLGDPFGIGIDELELYGDGTQPNIALEQPLGTPLTAGVATIAFGNQNAATTGPATTFTIKSTGTGQLGIGSVTTLGGAAGDFLINTTGMTPVLPAANGSTTFTVAFQPSGIGARSTTLLVTSSDPDPQHFTITLTGTGIDAYPHIAVEQPAATVLGKIATVTAWGNNGLGQLTVPPALTAVQALSAGSGHNLALKTDGTVAAWGTNRSGQLNVPVGLVGVIAIAAGAEHSLALKSDGTVVAWGYNSAGQSNVPSGLTGVTAIAGGFSHSVALKSDGTVVAWGWNNLNLINVPPGLTGVTAISAANSHTMALKSDGTVVTWGNYGYDVPAGLADVTAISAGAHHSLALRSDGTVVAWGSNQYGQLDVPPNLTNVQAIAAGGFFNLALKSDGTIVAWGSNEHGQLVIPASLSGVQTLAAGLLHTVVLYQKLPTVTYGVAPSGGTLSKTFTLRNTGLGTLNLTNITTTGGQASEFTVNTTGTATSLAAGATTTFSVAFTPTSTALKTTTLRIPSSDPAMPISEITLIGNQAFITLETGGTFAPNNLANGKTAFAQDEIDVAPHTIPSVNDGIYGNASSWIAGTLNSFIGINLGATPVPVDRIAFGRDNTGNQATRADGTYTVQYTTAPNPTAATPDASWQTIGNIANPGTLPSPSLRHLFSFNPVTATGIRLKVVASTTFEIGIDEIELYGPTATPLELWRMQYFGTTANTGTAADGFDHDKDGLTNLLEYALDQNPTQSSPNAFPQPVYSSGNIIYTFTQPNNVSGITYGAEWSTDLQTWNSIPDTGTAPQHIFSTPVGTDVRKFTRFKVTAP